MAKKRGRPQNKGNVEWEYCPTCKSKMNELGFYEFYCKACEKYFRKGKEIVYNINGEAVNVI